jgi:hypothetical protein
MPQASPELRAEWPGGDAEATVYLRIAGYTMRRDWTWDPPTPTHEPTPREISAIRYLIDEWDFGGLRS